MKATKRTGLVIVVTVLAAMISLSTFATDPNYSVDFSNELENYSIADADSTAESMTVEPDESQDDDNTILLIIIAFGGVAVIIIIVVLMTKKSNFDTQN